MFNDPAHDGLLIPIQQWLPLHLVRLGQESTLMVQNRKFVDDMGQMFGGRAAKPDGCVTIPSADGTSPIVVAAMGAVETAELQDIVYEAIENDAERVKRGGRAVDIAAERDRRGFAPKETFDQRYREMLQARVDYGKSHIRTRLTEPMTSMSKGQSMVAVPNSYPGGK